MPEQQLLILLKFANEHRLRDLAIIILEKIIQPTLNDATLTHIASLATPASFLSSLTFLDLSGCTLLTDKALKIVFKQFQFLQTLHVSHCTKLTGKTLKNLVSAPCSRTLTELNIPAGAGKTGFNVFFEEFRA